MNNLKALERFEKSHGARIGQLFWIAGSLENSDFKELAEEIHYDDYGLKKLFPEIKKEIFDEYIKDDNILELFIDYAKFGLIAEINVPEAYDFKFKKGSKKPWAWGIHSGICKIRYVYGETLEDLITQIEIESKDCWNYDLKKALSKKTTKKSK